MRVLGCLKEEASILVMTPPFPVSQMHLESFVAVVSYELYNLSSVLCDFGEFNETPKLPHLQDQIECYLYIIFAKSVSNYR